VDTLTASEVRPNETLHPRREHGFERRVHRHAGHGAVALRLKFQSGQQGRGSTGHVGRHDHGGRAVLAALQELAGGRVMVSDQGATNRPSNVLRVSTLSEETSPQAQTGETQTLFLEVRAVDLEARLVRLSPGS